MKYSMQRSAHESIFISYLKIKIIALSLITFAISGCGYRSDVVELNGYRIECDKSRDCIVASSKGDISVLIGPEVDKYFVVDKYIIGHATAPQISATPHPYPENIVINEKPGYFIVNTQDGRFFKGLSKNDWHSKLKKMGISPPQELSRTQYRVPQ